MNYELIIKPGAEQDIRETSHYYQRQKPELGIDFLLAVDNSLERIQENPEMYAVKYRDVRTARLSRFPFLIHYLMESSTIFVLAVVHSGRNPRDWKDRL